MSAGDLERARELMEWMHLPAYGVNGHAKLERIAAAFASIRAERDAEVEGLKKALRVLWECIENGALVRNTQHDGGPGWAPKAMKLVMALKHAQEALAPDAAKAAPTEGQK